jgi:hypothetical protein
MVNKGAVLHYDNCPGNHILSFEIISHASSSIYMYVVHMYVLLFTYILFIASSGQNKNRLFAMATPNVCLAIWPIFALDST